jgi:hypothetical protein
LTESFSGSRAGVVEAPDPTDRASIDAKFDEHTATVREPLDGQQVSDRTGEHLAALGYY